MFVRVLKSFPPRSNCPPVVEPEAVYTAQAALHVGNIVPLEIYISDYDTDTVPEWTVRSRETGEDGVLLLVLIDPNSAIPATLWEPAAEVARLVLSSPRQSLATSHYQLKHGYGPKPMM
jgi:hypothetical protein